METDIKPLNRLVTGRSNRTKIWPVLYFSQKLQNTAFSIHFKVPLVPHSANVSESNTVAVVKFCSTVVGAISIPTSLASFVAASSPALFFTRSRFHSESSMITREAAVKLMPSAQAVIKARSIFETPPGSSNLSITLPRSKSSSSPTNSKYSINNFTGAMLWQKMRIFSFWTMR
ncbi:hypothetical protein AHAS_Ahas07G0153300 [Arachis hypogaea]